MTTHTGKNGIVKVSTHAIAEVKTFTVEETGDTAETTSMGDEWRTYCLCSLGRGISTQIFLFYGIFV